jgi:hypothetical protein
MMSQAQLLQCPDCGHRHDLAALGDVPTFRCEDCGRALKVPAQFRNGAEPAPARATTPASAPAAAPTPTPRVVDDTMVQPVATAAAASPDPDPVVVLDDEPVARKAPAARPASRKPARTKVPIYWRILIWLAAIPIGLLFVFQVIARKLGWLTQNELIDAFTAGGWDRFRPIAQLLPLAAFVIAVIVSAAIYGLERWYKHRAVLRESADSDASAPKPSVSA